MGVRVPIELSAKSGASRDLRVLTSALANSGFETGRPELLIPTPLAEALGLTRGHASAAPRIYRTPGGEFEVLRIPRAVRVRIHARGAVGGGLIADAVVTGSESEVLLNDVLVGRLGIVLVDTAKGRWVLRGEDLRRPRRSVPRQVW